jgi:hypothetical protein
MQADLYKFLDVPAVFVGDGKLDSIGIILASLELLWSRGYRMDAMVFLEPGSANGDGRGGDGGGGIQLGSENAEALHEYMAMHHNRTCLDGNLITCLLPLLPRLVAMKDWYNSNQEVFWELHHLLC